MATNSEPFEVIAGPIEVYRAPVATTFPVIGAAPAVDWTLIGKNGSKDYAESGLTIRHVTDIATWYSLGRSGPVKSFMNQEGLEIEFIVNDLTAEAYAQGLNKDVADVVDTPAASGVPGYRSLELSRGFAIPTWALLLRLGMSPYGDGFVSQWEIPMAQNIGTPELVFVKNEPVGIQYMFRCLEDPVNGFGNVRFQDAVAL